MKKILWLLLLTTVACSKIDYDEDLSNTLKENSSTTLKNYTVGINDVDVLLNVCDEFGTLSTDSYQIDPIVYNNDTLLYTVNFIDKGWAIISGDKRTEPILAFCDSVQTFNIDKMGPGVFTWLDDMADEIYCLKTSNDTTISISEIWTNILPYTIASSETTSSSSLKMLAPDEDDAGYWVRSTLSSTSSTSSTQKGPYIKTKWDQHDPFNQCVPRISASSATRCVAGCVAIATSQLMYFGHYNGGKPSWMYSSGYCNGYSVSSSNYSYSFGFSNASTTVWDKMALKDSYYNSSSSELYTSILIGYVGNKLGMSYTEDASGASTDDVPGLLNNFGIGCSNKGYSYSTVISDLNSGTPVYISAYAGRKDHKLLGIHLYYTYYDGHAWIIDGYQAKTTRRTYTYLWKYYDSDGNEDYSQRYTTTGTSTSTVRYYIMNWGWSDGYYDSGRYLATSSSFTDGGYTFKYEKQIICDLDFN